jgi:Asp-tRNA(Asn)/Glu-tRNA(Gln) amidotransferase B subunit
MNKGAVERAIRFGLAIGAHVAPRSIFARKNYFYPDLPKGYQISQFEIPVVQGGAVEFFWARRRSRCAWCARTWKRTPASRCTRTSSASPAST